MVEDGMKFKKVKHIPMNGNKDRSLVLRQQWALTFLALPLGTRIICIDETWLGMSDFRRMKWQKDGNDNSVAAFSLVPRVTMLAALDSLGNAWISLA